MESGENVMLGDRRLRPTGILAVAVVVVAPTVVAAPAVPAIAGGTGEILVTTFDDEILVDGDCSLREAVIAANTDTAVDACPAGDGGDHILLGVGSYELTIPGAGEDAGLTGDLDLTGSTNISTVDVGRNGWATIDGGGLDRIFDVHGSARRWSVTWLILTNGDAGSGDGGAIRIGDGTCDELGFADGFGDLASLLVEGNRAARGGGVHIGSCRHPEVAYVSLVGNTASEAGGGLSIVGETDTRILNSTISGNDAATGGGGIWADTPDHEASLHFATIADNAAPDGAGVWTSGAAQLLSPIIADNDGANCAGPGTTYVGGLSDDGTCAGSQTDDAGLLPLERVGNAMVHPLADGSVAIEFAGPAEPQGDCYTVVGDQLGTTRPLDGDGDGLAYCDAGAVEHAAVPPATPSPTEPESPGESPPLPDTALPVPTR